jgi:hypothetical protein
MSFVHHPRTIALLVATLLSAGIARADATEDALFGGEEETTDDKKKPEEKKADQKSTEDELFGGPAGDPPKATEKTAVPPNQEGKDNEALVAGDAAALVARTNENNDKLVVGGRVFLNTQWTQRAFGTATQKRTDLLNQDLFDIYLDGRPTERVRSYIRARLNYSAVNGTGTGQTGGVGAIGAPAGCTSQVCFQLDQAWVKFDANNKAFFTIGRQRIKWGASRFWNPTDFMNQQRLNSLAVIDTRLGVDLIKAHIPIESKASNYYVLASIQDTSRPNEVGIAVRGEWAVGDRAEVTASAAWRLHNPVRIGVDASWGLGPFDLRAELALLNPVERNQMRYASGTLDPVFTNASLAERAGWDLTQLQFPTVKDRFDSRFPLYPQVVLGGDIQIPYSDQDNVIVGLEYFYNSLGYQNADLLPFLFFSGLYTPLYTGQHYAALYTSLPNPGSWNNTSFTLSLLGNLSDRSFVGRFNYAVTLLTKISLNAFVQNTFGSNGEFHYSVNSGPWEFIPTGAEQFLPNPLAAAAPNLRANGLQIAPTTVSAGLSLIMNL